MAQPSIHRAHFCPPKLARTASLAAVTRANTTRTATGIALSALLFSGCSSAPATAPAATIPGAGPIATPLAGQNPAPSLVSTTSPSTATPDVLAAMPLAARQRNADGAEAFVRYFLDIHNEDGIHPTNGRLTPLSSPACKTCAGFDKLTRDLNHDKQRFAGPPLTIKIVAGLDGLPETDPQYRVGARLIEGVHPILTESGGVFQRIPRKEFTFIFYLTWSRTAWTVDEIKLLDETKP